MYTTNSGKFFELISNMLIAEMKKEGNLRLTLTVEEASKALGINKIKMYELTRTECFPKLRLGNRIVIPILQLLDWIENNAWDKAS